MRTYPLCLAAILIAAPLAPASIGAVEFEKDIFPIFEKKCIKCHKAPYEEEGKLKKPKADLRMDAAWAIHAGSENGEVVVAGKPDDSELYYRVTLPEDDDDFMPPSGKADPLTEKELAVFKKWIEDGADFGGWIGSLEGKPKEVTNTGETIPISEIQEVYKSLAEGVELQDDAIWEPVTAAGGRVARLARTSPLLSIDFRLTSEDANDEAIGSIGAVAPFIVHLDLSKTAITDSGLSVLTETPNLVRLNLSQSAVGDTGLKQLKGLSELRYLNLYDSKVTDAGLKELGGLSNLESVYLWKTGATEAGVKKLRQALPNAKVNFK
tara:strand:+ start:1319 stop:2287 length:969 start_codon:yes stop_codon:yes gene_type:complete